MRLLFAQAAACFLLPNLVNVNKKENITGGFLLERQTTEFTMISDDIIEASTGKFFDFCGVKFAILLV